jgi:hypothetical protein
MTELRSGRSFETGGLPGESGMAGDHFAGRTGGGTRIRIAGVDGPPVADAGRSRIDPVKSRQSPFAAHTAGFAS